MTLSDLIKEYNASGFVLMDAGNGSYGPCWVNWDKDTEVDYGDIEMIYGSISNNDMHAYLEYLDIMPGGCPQYSSKWIISDEGYNPYRYRIIF